MTAGEPVADSLLAEQAAYYRARAPEYERWWLRKGRFDQGEADNRAWFDEIDEVVAAFEALPLDGARVLELAPGTGIWTERLARRASSVVAVDSSMEMVAINRERLGPLAEKVSFIDADLFTWRPTERFDGIAFCFWISHVPDERLPTFLSWVAEAVVPGGFVFFLDGLPEPTSTAVDHVLPGPTSPVMIRRLDDGREFQMVKQFRTAEFLRTETERAGLSVEIFQTERYFQYGVGSRPA